MLFFSLCPSLLSNCPSSGQPSWRTVYHKAVYSLLSSSMSIQNDQPIHEGTKSFIYADDLCIAAQEDTFEEVECQLKAAFNNVTGYYTGNCLRATLEKIQAISFHLRSKNAIRDLSVKWNGTQLENIKCPKYIHVTHWTKDLAIRST